MGTTPRSRSTPGWGAAKTSSILTSTRADPDPLRGFLAIPAHDPPNRTRAPGNLRYNAPSGSRPQKETSRGVGAMLQEFKTFAMRGNVIDLAVGIIIGAAFTAIVSSLVDDIIMPPIGLIL